MFCIDSVIQTSISCFRQQPRANPACEDAAAHPCNYRQYYVDEHIVRRGRDFQVFWERHSNPRGTWQPHQSISLAQCQTMRPRHCTIEKFLYFSCVICVDLAASPDFQSGFSLFFLNLFFRRKAYIVFKRNISWLVDLTGASTQFFLFFVIYNVFFLYQLSRRKYVIFPTRTEVLREWGWIIR